METFKLRSVAEGKVPPIRVAAPYYRMLCQIKAETGIPMSTVVERCIDYAFQNGDNWEQNKLAQFIRPGIPTGCPLLTEPAIEDKEGGTACPERI